MSCPNLYLSCLRLIFKKPSFFQVTDDGNHPLVLLFYLHNLLTFCARLPLLSLHIIRRSHCNCPTKLILLESQLLNFWLKAFAQSPGCQSAVKVVGRSLSTCASFLLWLHNLPSIVQLLVENQLGQ